MKFKTSYFNLSVLRKNLQRCIPLIGIYTALWLLILPIGYVTTSKYWAVNELALEATQYVARLATTYGVICNLLYGIAVAMVLYSYLYTPRLANMIHALPIRREGLYLTNYVSGLFCSLVPNLIVALVTVIISRGVAWEGTLQWFCIMTQHYVFFLGFSFFLAQLTGNLIALPIFYLILNFAVPVLEALARTLLQCFVFGLSGSGAFHLSFLSPVYYLLSYNTQYGTHHIRLYLILLTAIGIVLACAALLLYRIRKIETAGDVVSFPVLRPIFKYCFAIGCAIILGTLIILVVGIDLRYGQVLPVLICLFIGAFFGYFGSEMALKKKIGVFRREWIGYIVLIAVISGSAGLLLIDALGYSSYQPAQSEIQGVNLEFDVNSKEQYTDNAEAINAVYDLHAKIIKTRPVVSTSAESTTINIAYQLKNGKTVSRTYTLRITEDCNDQDYELSNNLATVYDLPALIINRSLPALPLQTSQIVDASISYFSYDESSESDVNAYNTYYELDSSFIQTLIDTCILPDIEDGTLLTTFTDVENSDWSSEYYLTFGVGDAKQGQLTYYGFQITEQSTRTFQALKEEQLRQDHAE